MTRLYFDTNVYTAIAKHNVAKKLRERLNLRGFRVVTSFEVIIETLRCPVASERNGRLNTAKALASDFANPAPAYLEAMELRDEIHRLRPSWINEKPDLREFYAFRRNSGRLWDRIRNDPDFDPLFALQSYLADAEPAGQKMVESQKDRRQFNLENPASQLTSADPEIAKLLADKPQTEIYWRMQGAAIWRKALDGVAALRDYRDWLGPFLKGKIALRDWLEFWLEINPNNMPHSRVREITEYYQVTQKISHGNAQDLNHAQYLLYCDLFITRDRNFHSILENAASDPMFPKTADFRYFADTEGSDPTEILLDTVNSWNEIRKRK